MFPFVYVYFCLSRAPHLLQWDDIVVVDASCQPQKRAGSGARDLCDFMRQNEMDRWTGSGSDLLMNVDRVELSTSCGGCVFVWKTIKGGPPLSLLSRQLTVRGERGESSDQFDDFIGGAGRRSCLIWPWREFIKFIKNGLVLRIIGRLLPVH